VNASLGVGGSSGSSNASQSAASIDEEEITLYGLRAIQRDDNPNGGQEEEEENRNGYNDGYNTDGESLEDDKRWAEIENDNDCVDAVTVCANGLLLIYRNGVGYEVRLILQM
jgi:hypothetical protein